MPVREMYTEEEMWEKLKKLKPGEILYHKGYKPVPKLPGKSVKRQRMSFPMDDRDGEPTHKEIRAAWRKIFAEKTPEERARLEEYAALLYGE